MNDIKVEENNVDSRAEKLAKKYIKTNGLEWSKLEALRDISITLAMILDEIRR